MNIADRIQYAQKLNTDAKRSVELAMCAADPVHFINHWIWTLDPRELNSGRPAEIPMVLWPKQDEFIRWIQRREAASGASAVPKSRDAGATYCAIAYAIHGVLFRPGFRAGFGSATEEDVDKIGDMKSIFERIRFMMRRIPRWMLEACGITDLNKAMSFRRLTNEARASGVTGDCGDNIGRSDRTGIYFCDEAAQYVHPQLVDTALSGTTNCRIDISTYKGQNAFYNRVMRLQADDADAVFPMSWLDDPRKRETRIDENGKEINIFEEQKRVELGDPVLWNQEYGMDPTGSVEGICIPHEWVKAAIGLNLPQSGPLFAGEDIAEEGKDRTVLGFRRGPVVTEIIDWGQVTTFETAARTAEECQKRGVVCLNFDVIGVGLGPKGIWIAMEESNTLGFIANPINSGDEPTEICWPDGKTSKEKFHNYRAEIWWLLRTRFERTWEHVVKGIDHPPEDMISIPNHSQLIMELSTPKRKYTDRMKIKIESKDEMRQRGVKSPDFADMVAMLFAPVMLDFVVTDVARRDSATMQLPKNISYDGPKDAGEQDDPTLGPDYINMRF